MPKGQSDKPRRRKRCARCGGYGHIPRCCKEAQAPDRQCNTCNRTFPISEFPRTNYQPEYGLPYHLNKCKACFSIKSKQNYSRSNIKIRSRWYNAKSRSLRDGVPFALDIHFLLNMYEAQHGKCFYTGLQMSMENGPMTLSLERIDPSRGYAEDNVALCIWRVNEMKKEMTRDDFVDMCALVAKRAGKF